MPGMCSVACMKCGKKFDSPVVDERIDGSWVSVAHHSFCSEECTQAFSEMTGQPWDGKRQ